MSSRFIVTLRFKLISGWLRGYLGLAYGLFSVGLGVFLKVGETYRKLFFCVAMGKLRENGGFQHLKSHPSGMVETYGETMEIYQPLGELPRDWMCHMKPT